MDSKSKLARTLAGFPPYGGLKNEPGLPAFATPGAMMPMDLQRAQQLPPFQLPGLPPEGLRVRAPEPPPLPEAPPPVNRLDFLPPYAGLKNEPGLPPFLPPGQFAASYMPQMPPAEVFAPQEPPQSAAMPAPSPAPMQVASVAPQMAPDVPQMGGQGYAGPEPMMPPAYDPMKDPRYLPEQWRGAFNPRWQT